MRHGLALGLLAAAFSVSAHAASLYPISLTGLDSSNSPFSIDFSLDPTTAADNMASGYVFNDVSGKVDGVADTLTINATPGGFFGDSLEIADGSSLDEFLSISPNFSLLTGFTNFIDAGNPPTINTGSYSGIDYTSCLSASSVHMHFPGSGLPATMAMFQMPSLSVSCEAAVTLGVSNPASSVTPEPSSMALFATGALGLAGVIRRRFHA